MEQDDRAYPVTDEAYKDYLGAQAMDHAARSRSLFDLCAKFLFSLNGGGIGVVMGIAGATTAQVNPGRFIGALVMFCLGLVFITVTVYLTWRISKAYALKAMDLRDGLVAAMADDAGAGMGAAKQWHDFVQSQGQDDVPQVLLLSASFICFVIGLLAAAASILEI